ncbi:hypothetical protein BGZ99_008548 [Dissophora globulifera]|uniref:Nudix hydrolase domain-containing protein n=1 Tax=Dissophora globulifera TaxID=979702 RepID=A0A9P6UZ86_9FUNG|nr:hypothetical protein BGZ99_008548 [Dissophora globulifera]
MSQPGAKYLNEKSLKALELLRSHPYPVDNFHTSKRYAVLVALIANNDGDLEVILTVRSTLLRTGAGDSACPGGKMDLDDVDLIATAKREAWEEVRLPPSESQLLTISAPILSRQMQLVTPIVVYCPNMTTADISSLCPNPGEVDAIFTTPLEYFLNPQPELHSFIEMQWTHSLHRIHSFEGCGASNHVIREQELTSKNDRRPTSSLASSRKIDRTNVGWIVYGMTANILLEVGKIAYQREPAFQMYAQGQITDVGRNAEWFNDSFRPRSSL